MNTEPTTLYYLASPEAAALIEAHLAAVDAHKAAAFQLKDATGATGVIFDRYSCCMALVFDGVPLPEGWKFVPKKRKFPAYSATGPAGWYADFPSVPSRTALYIALGIGEIQERSFIRDGQLIGAAAGYGIERVGNNFVLSQYAFDGKPFGNPPAGCRPIKKSEYYALKGE